MRRKPRSPRSRSIGYGKPAELAQLVVAQAAQRLDVGEAPRVERRHGVEPQQVQPRHAQVDAVDRPVVQARDAERAAVAHAAAQHLPGVAEVVAVLPRDARHVAKVVRFRLAEAERNGARQALFPGLLSMRCDMNAPTLCETATEGEDEEGKEAGVRRQESESPSPPGFSLGTADGQPRESTSIASPIAASPGSTTFQ